jgi:ArsR family transcriptional regulator, arsenate/arsenite/antimonite-responsive transcriptional repressor
MELKTRNEKIANYANMLSAMGTEARLRIMRLLLLAYPDGLVVGDIQSALGIPGSTLSHHLEKLKRVNLIKIRRERQFLWYSANSEALEDLLSFLFAECCSRSRAVRPETIASICK